jgi:hypothetical protein
MMEKYIISKLKNDFIFWKKKLFISSVWKLTLVPYFSYTSAMGFEIFNFEDHVSMLTYFCIANIHAST